MRFVILSVVLILSSCLSDFRMQQKRISNQRSSVTILSAAVEGDDLSKSEGRYFSNKLSEFLLNDSLQISERSVVNAYEISMQLEGRFAYTPKELQKLASNFPSDYYILSRCKRLDPKSIEITITIIDKSHNTRLIKSEVITVPLKSNEMNVELAKAAEELAYAL